MQELSKGKLVSALFGLSACAAVFVGPAGTSGSAAEEIAGPKEVTFTFAPPDGTTFVQSLVKTTDKVFEGLGRQLDEASSDTSIVIRRAPNEFVITATPISMKMTRNGKAVAHPINELMKDVVVTYHVSPGGALTGIEGFAGLLDKLKESVSPKIYAALAPALIEQSLIARETSEWNARIGEYAGGMAEIGDTFVSEIPYTLGNGETITYSRVIFISGWEACPDGSCVRVKIQYDSDAQALSNMVSEMASKLIEQTGNDSGTAAASDSRISGEASWLIDPATMLIYAETRARTMSMSLEIPGRGLIPTTMKEQSQYSFDYK